MSSTPVTSRVQSTNKKSTDQIKRSSKTTVEILSTRNTSNPSPTFTPYERPDFDKLPSDFDPTYTPSLDEIMTESTTIRPPSTNKKIEDIKNNEIASSSIAKQPPSQSNTKRNS